MSMIGKLTRYRVRDIWSNENEFSDWLYMAENLNLLTESLGIDTIQPLAREEYVGDFRIDIFGIEDNSDRKVIIENQFESSDHDHLGKIITYAAGKDASIIIWIVEDVRPEHASAIDWLNLNMADRGFFLVQLEVVRIGDSLPAPIFTVIQKPNEWTKAIKSDSDGSSQLKYSFWRGFLDCAKKDKEFCKVFPIGSRKPSSDRWITFSRGCKGDYQLVLNIFHRNGVINGLAIDAWVSDNKEFFGKFEDHKSDIESDFGGPLEWYNKPDKKAACARIKIELEPGQKTEELYSWLMTTSVKMVSAFNKYA